MCTISINNKYVHFKKKTVTCVQQKLTLYLRSMKLTVLQDEFAKALLIATRFTSSKVQLPILNNILLTAQKNGVTITATNLEISVSFFLGAEIEKEGSITVPARTLFDIVSNLKKGQITLEKKDEKLRILAEGFSGTITGMPSDDFPPVPNALSKNSFSVSTKELSKALSSILFAVSVDESRPILTGALFIIAEGKLSLVATDGFRLSHTDIHVDGKGNARIIIPKGILQELVRLKDEDEVIQCSYAKEENQLVCKLGKAIISSRLIEGEFPDFERIIPKETTTRIIVGKSDFIRAIKIAAVFAKDSSNVVTCKVGENVIHISAESPQKGNQSTELEAEIKKNANSPLRNSNEEFTIAFNCKFIEDFISDVNGDEIEIGCTDVSSPVIFKDLSNPNFLHIIMPIKLQN